MREIKFRAWCGDMIMINDFLFLDKNNNHVMAANFTNDHPCISKVVDVMQYTGRKDKNGKEIYEGDIVVHSYDQKRKQRRYKVEFTIYRTSGWVINCINDKRIVDRAMGWYSELEIIGNIHQNPELLI